MHLEAINLRKPTWFVALVREALDAWIRGEAILPEDAEAFRKRGSARSLFLGNMCRQVWAITAWSEAVAISPSPSELRLGIAIVFSAATSRWQEFEALRLAHAELKAEGEWTVDDVNARFVPCAPALGKRLLEGLFDDDDPFLGGPFHHTWMRGDLRFVGRLSYDFFAGTLDRDLAEAYHARLRVERLSYVEAVIGLVWSDGRLEVSERRLVQAMLRTRGFSAGERALLGHALKTGEVTVERIASEIEQPQDRRHLLQTLMVAASIDGDYSTSEAAWIDDLATALEIEPQEVVLLRNDVESVNVRTLQSSLASSLTVRGLVARSLRASRAQVEEVVRRNLDAVLAEARQTGDLVALLAKSVGEPLSDEENARVRGQLLDVCRAVPALALFAAPGGAILLPVLARVLPFSLFPSSFQDDEERL